MVFQALLRHFQWHFSMNHTKIAITHVYFIALTFAPCLCITLGHQYYTILSKFQYDLVKVSAKCTKCIDAVTQSKVPIHLILKLLHFLRKPCNARHRLTKHDYRKIWSMFYSCRRFTNAPVRQWHQYSETALQPVPLLACTLRGRQTVTVGVNQVGQQWTEPATHSSSCYL